jgi:hypothetical protein
LNWTCAAWDGASEVRASCRVDASHRAPAATCHCGLYAYHAPHLPWRMQPVTQFPDVVFGIVAARGRIEVHAEGFRAEYARPVCIVSERGQRQGPGGRWKPHPGTAEALVAARCPDLPIVPPEDVDRLVEGAGHPIPYALRP